jgi:hypothetical protein
LHAADRHSTILYIYRGQWSLARAPLSGAISARIVAQSPLATISRSLVAFPAIGAIHRSRFVVTQMTAKEAAFQQLERYLGNLQKAGKDEAAALGAIANVQSLVTSEMSPEEEGPQHFMLLLMLSRPRTRRPRPNINLCSAGAVLDTLLNAKDGLGAIEQLKGLLQRSDSSDKVRLDLVKVRMRQ